jgi:hypothetical protein
VWRQCVPWNSVLETYLGKRIVRELNFHGLLLCDSSRVFIDLDRKISETGIAWHRTAFSGQWFHRFCCSYPKPFYKAALELFR